MVISFLSSAVVCVSSVMSLADLLFVSDVSG